MGDVVCYGFFRVVWWFLNFCSSNCFICISSGEWCLECCVIYMIWWCIVGRVMGRGCRLIVVSMFRVQLLFKLSMWVLQSMCIVLRLVVVVFMCIFSGVMLQWVISMFSLLCRCVLGGGSSQGCVVRFLIFNDCWCCSGWVVLVMMWSLFLQSGMVVMFVGSGFGCGVIIVFSLLFFRFVIRQCISCLVRCSWVVGCFCSIWFVSCSMCLVLVDGLQLMCRIFSLLVFI